MDHKTMFHRSNFVGNIVVIFLSISWWSYGVASIDYKAALTKSLLYYEAQRSGKLPPNQRVTWRGDSGLQDGSDNNIDLTGGYYDAGDHVKFGFPMAFTITMLSWSVVDFREQLRVNNELSNALDAIKWGTDYLMRAHPEPGVLYGEVGDGDSDHACWQRPEDMTTPRTSFKIDEDHPGSDLAAETAAAFAAASIAFAPVNSSYADQLRAHAAQLFEFTCNSTGLYHESIPAATKFYKSSGDEDELLWAAAWLFRATTEQMYKDILSAYDGGVIRSMFSWDDKYVGVQVLVAKQVLDGIFEDYGTWDMYKEDAESFICSCIQKSNNNVKMTPGGLLWFQPWNNLQYTTLATFIVTVYSDYVSSAMSLIECDAGDVEPSDQIAFAQSQVDYILGSNPNNMSYMVGFGPKFPSQVHHRGASIVSIKKDATLVTCQGGYDLWFHKNESDPNVLDGAIVGGPDENDGYTDSRSNYQQTQPAIVNTAPLVGVLARLIPSY